MLDDLIYLLAMIGGFCLLLALTGWLSDRYYLWCLRQEEDKARLRRPLRVRKVKKKPYEPQNPKGCRTFPNGTWEEVRR